MSKRIYHAIECDGCMDEPSYWPTAAEARTEIRKVYRWTHHRDDTDHCPNCEAQHRAGTLDEEAAR